MSTEVALSPAEQRRQAVLAKVHALKAGGQAPTAFAGGVQYCKCDGRNGDFVYGKDQTPVPEDQTFIVALDEARHGMLEWEQGQVKNELMTKILDGPAPAMPAGGFLVDTKPKPYDKDGWKSEMSMQMVGVNGGDLDAITLEFSCRAASQMQEIQNLMAKAIAQTETPDGAQGFFNPVVKVRMGDFYSKKQKATYYFPIWDVVGWSDGFEIKDVAGTEAIAPASEEEFLNS